MPNRIIKESILTSASIDALGESAEIFFYRLLVTADDQGRFWASPGYLFPALFPLKADRFADDPEYLADFLRQAGDNLLQLAAADIIILYEVEGRQYGYFVSWNKHQRIRNVRPKHPAPEKGSIISTLQDPPQSAAKLPQVAAENGQPAAESARNPNPNMTSNPNQEERVEEFSFELDVVELFNQKFPDHPKLSEPVIETKTGLTTLKQIRMRRKERKWGEEIGPWVTFFNDCAKSEFLMKKMRWFDLQWITRPTNMEKAERGKYKDGEPQKGKGHRGVEADKLSEADRRKFEKYSE